jgi:FkbM family methyltransferase
MQSLNTLSNNSTFKKTRLYSSFREQPLGFIDEGAAGGIHPLIMPIASMTHCTCFEPDPEAYEKLFQSIEKNKHFKEFTLSDVALGIGQTDALLYLTKSPVNSSLLKPRNMLVDPYGVEGFNLDRKVQVQAESLDKIVKKYSKKGIIQASSSNWTVRALSMIFCRMGT